MWAWAINLSGPPLTSSCLYTNRIKFALFGSNKSCWSRSTDVASSDNMPPHSQKSIYRLVDTVRISDPCFWHLTNFYYSMMLLHWRSSPWITYVVSLGNCDIVEGLLVDSHPGGQDTLLGLTMYWWRSWPGPTPGSSPGEQPASCPQQSIQRDKDIGKIIMVAAVVMQTAQCLCRHLPQGACPCPQLWSNPS